MKATALFLFMYLLAVPAEAQGQSFNLTVVNGFGSGVYNEGDSVHVWAKAVFADSVFVNWTGNGELYLKHQGEWHTILTVPPGSGTGDVTIAANFDDLPSTIQMDSIHYLLFARDSTTLFRATKVCYYQIPPEPKAMVFLFHGSESKGQNFFRLYESNSVIKDLVYDGFGVFTLDANERTVGDLNGDGKIRWSIRGAATANDSNNVDLRNVVSLKDSLQAEFSLPSNIPLFSLGSSNGSYFSDICASALGFNASAHVTGNGSDSTYTRPDIAPVIWVMSENDNNPNADSVLARANYNQMRTSQDAEWHTFRRSPAFPRRFVRSLQNISRVQSESVFARLRSEGYLNSANMLTYLSLDSIPDATFNGLGLSIQQRLSIRQQLLSLNGDHVLHSDLNKNIIRFFNEHLSPTAIGSNRSNSRKEQMVSVYPNPFRSKTTIRFNIRPNERYTLRLFNILGQVVRVVPNISSGMVDIRRSNLPSGLYVYQIRSAGVIRASGKLIIE